jgi:hypothetical protein
MSVASVAQLLLEQSGGGGLVEDITAGDGIDVNEVSTGVFEISNIGVVSITAGIGSGINVDASTGDINISNTGVLEITAGAGIDINETSAGVFEIVNTGGGGGGGVDTVVNGVGIDASIAGTTLTIASTVNPADYSTTAEANALYQPLTGMANYSTTAEANALYAPINSGVLSLTAGAGIGISSSTGDITVSALAVTRVGGAKTQTTIQAGTLQYSQHALNNVTILNFVGSENNTAYTMTSNTVGQPASFGCNVFFQSTDGTDTIVEPYYTYLGLPPANNELIQFAITAVNF